MSAVAPNAQMPRHIPSQDGHWDCLHLASIEIDPWILDPPIPVSPMCFTITVTVLYTWTVSRNVLTL